MKNLSRLLSILAGVVVWHFYVPPGKAVGRFHNAALGSIVIRLRLVLVTLGSSLTPGNRTGAVLMVGQVGLAVLN